MADIIETYQSAIEAAAIRNNRGNWYTDRQVLDTILTDPNFQKSDLGLLASHLADSIVRDKYPDYNPNFPLMDLFNIRRLQKDGRIVLNRGSVLQAIYHLIEEYLLPEDEQKYRIGRHLSSVLHAVVALHLEREFDISYIIRAIERAKRDESVEMIRGWEDIRRQIESGQRRRYDR